MKDRWPKQLGGRLLLTELGNTGADADVWGVGVGVVSLGRVVYSLPVALNHLVPQRLGGADPASLCLRCLTWNEGY